MIVQTKIIAFLDDELGLVGVNLDYVSHVINTIRGEKTPLKADGAYSPESLDFHVVMNNGKTFVGRQKENKDLDEVLELGYIDRQ